MSKSESKQVLDKIYQGIQLAVKRLVDQTKLEDGELVISKNGKVIRVKARDL